MLSDFEVAKPKQEFNQLHLDLYEVLVYTAKVRLFIPKIVDVQGLLHLTTRGFVFQPKNEVLALIKLKFSDVLATKFSKANNDAITEQLKQSTVTSELYHRLFNVEEKLYDRKSIAPLSKKFGTIFIKGTKIYTIERNPPSPLSGEITPFILMFYIESPKFKNFKGFSSSKGDSLFLINELERTVENIINSDNEDTLVKDLYLQRTENAKVDLKAKKAIEFFYPVQIIQTFEKFYGYICLTDDYVCKIISVLNSTTHIKAKFNCREVKWLTQYSYLHEDVGIEIFLYTTNLSYLVLFDNKNRAEKVLKLLKEKCKEIIDIQIDSLTKTWMNNLMSNYDYLMYLNRLSNRSFNDISRYPIFPWVISDYHNEQFKINNKNQYRDLSKPIGCINKTLVSKINERYNYMKNDPVPIRSPCHFNSFVSTPGYMNYFYLRAVPNLILKLQSGAFAPSDRVFKGFEHLWSLIYKGNTQPVELIPEFYSLNKTDLFLNKYRVDLGVSNDGKEIDDVEVGKWAAGIEDFMYKMRAALESDHCSLTLQHWIDIVFGVNQKINTDSCLNVFSENCYKEGFYRNIKGATKQKIEAERLQVYEYGQTPVQLFAFPHPKKRIRAQIIYQNINKEERKSKGENKQITEAPNLNDNDEYKRQNSNLLFHKLEQLRENFDQTESQPNFELETPKNENQFFYDLSNSKGFDEFQFDSDL